MNSKPAMFQATFWAIFMLLSACTPASTPSPETPTFLHPSGTPLPSNTAIPTATIIADLTSTPTATFTPTLIPTVTITPVYIGMSVPQTGEGIGLTNQERLAKVAEWGRGRIQGVGFTPDGLSFVVGGALGFTVYDMKNLSSQPHWQSFDTPANYHQLFSAPTDDTFY